MPSMMSFTRVPGLKFSATMAARTMPQVGSMTMTMRVNSTTRRPVKGREAKAGAGKPEAGRQRHPGFTGLYVLR